MLVSEWIKNDKPSSEHCDEPGQAYLGLVGLSKSYLEGNQNRVVLKNVSLELCQGESVAILGKSGSGKTTILNLISGIDRADAGDIFLGGSRLTGMKENERTLFRRSRIGFIFQFFNLIPTLTVWEKMYCCPWSLMDGQTQPERSTPAACWLKLACRIGCRPFRTAFRAGSSSGLRLPGPWCMTRFWSLRMSQPVTWMRKPAKTCWLCWIALPARRVKTWSW
jgi:ABC-type Fe3+/spermidine/putrescine transport system ATPase subunit